MNAADLLTLLESGELDKLKSTLEISRYAYFVNDAFANAGNTSNVTTGTIGAGQNLHVDDFKQYNPKRHDIHDKAKRMDKVINGESGNPEKIIQVARLSLPEQKKIVLMASTFLGSPELSATPKPGIETDLYDVLEAIFDKNKLDYQFRDITKRTMSERECAELWYTQEAEPEYWAGTPLAGAKFKLRCRILSPALGDSLYPVWDEYGDMIAFGRYYETIDVIAGSPSQTDRTAYFDIYTPTRFYFYTKKKTEQEWSVNFDPTQVIANEDGSTSKVKGIPNIIGKIPVIYYSQPATEWNDVQEMIDRLEKKLSNHADTNDYFDSPIVVAAGDVTGFADKGEQGKLLTAKNGATVEYLTWDNAPESMKMEIENLRKNIHTYTHTPDISFDNIKGLGTFSGIALKMFFMDAHLKASDKEELFGQGVQRRINYLKTSISIIDQKFKPALSLYICPTFEYFLPRDVDGEVKTLVAAYQAGIISLQTAVKLNPLVEDYAAELEQIALEATAASGSGALAVGDSVTIAPGKEKDPAHAGATMTIAAINGDQYDLKLADGSIYKSYTAADLVAA